VSQSPRPIPARTAELLQAYSDGELSAFARWRFARRLRRSPELQRELAALRRVGDWVRAAQVEESGPDLWDVIALRLPAIDVRRAEAAAKGGAGIGRLAWPGAFATAALAAVLAFVTFSPPAPTAPAPPARVVRWLDSGPRDVMVLEPAPDTTVVWVIGPPGKVRPKGEDGKV
jgi:anti-sigma factor RsiW